jgi:hypothetical protein
VTKIHADVEALRGLRETLARFRYDQRDSAGRGEGEIEVARGELEARASSARAWLEQCRAELEACLQASSAAVDGSASSASSDDCSGLARAVAEAEERLEHVRRWQQRVEQEASLFYGAAMRFRDRLENDLPRTEDHLLDMITSLEAARRVQAAGS